MLLQYTMPGRRQRPQGSDHTVGLEARQAGLLSHYDTIGQGDLGLPP